MIITRKDPFTKEVNTMELPITKFQLERWEAGELIQDIMPSLTPDQREFIMTGITPDSWEKNIHG